MTSESLAHWVAPRTIAVDGQQIGVGIVTAELREKGNEWMLVLGPAKVGTEVTREQTLLESRISNAAIWCQRASWQVRALLTRGRDATIRISTSDLASTSVTDLSMMPPVGSLIRPLFLEFTPTPELRSFQRAGVEWLLTHPRGILADDMGLGKTLQALEAIRTRIYGGETRTAVVVCPRTLVATWLSEAHKWSPVLAAASSTSWKGTATSLWSLVKDNRVHLLILHYEQLKGLPKTELDGTEIDLLVLDEAHRARRSEATVTSSVRALSSSSLWAMSGTPIERSTDDLATLLSIIAPEKFASSTAQLGPDAMRSLARPYVLRRRKADVLDELPNVDDTRHVLELLPEQRVAYRNALSSPRREGANAGALLRIIGELLTICDADPGTGASSKLNDIRDRLIFVGQENEKAVVFSYRLRPLRLLESMLATVGLGSSRIDGQMPIEERNAALKRFREDSSITALLASSRVASEGLTLTEANHAFFVNRWWNPSNTDQARDRLVRIGQQRQVSIHSYICAATIEERLDEILVSKTDLVQRVVESLATGRWSSSSKDDLNKLLNSTG